MRLVHRDTGRKAYTPSPHALHAMTRLATLLAVVLAAPLASAQTAADAWPLVPGNSWTYILFSGTEGTQGGSSELVAGGSVWTATDSVETASGRLPGLRVGSVDCVVRISEDAGATTFELLDPAAEAPCAVAPGASPVLLSDSPGFVLYGAPGAPTTVLIGGEPISDVPVRLGFDDGGLTRLSWSAGDDVGVLGFFKRVGQNSFGGTSRGSLRQATLGGVTTGQPLATRTDFWPLAVGNRWEFLVTDERTNTSAGAVRWTVEAADAGLALRLDHFQDDALVSTVTCPLSRGEASQATGWKTQFSLSGCVLPETLLAPNIASSFSAASSLDIDIYAVGQSVVIGAQTVVTDVASGSEYRSGGANGPTAATTYRLGREIGPVGYHVEFSGTSGTPPRQWDAVLAFARVGTMMYGEQVVAEEAAPAAAEALALSVGPNPARASLALAFSLPAASDARLEVVDALGRMVQRLDLGARGAGAQTARLDVSGLAAGVYSVRLVAGAAQTATQISVVR